MYSFTPAIRVELAYSEEGGGQFGQSGEHVLHNSHYFASQAYTMRSFTPAVRVDFEHCEESGGQFGARNQQRSERGVLTKSNLRYEGGVRINRGLGVGLNKIIFYMEALVHESIILVLSPPTCIAHTIAKLLHDYCAIYDAPPTPFCLLYTIQYWPWHSRVKVKFGARG